MLVMDKHGLHIEWSDTSGMVRSQTMLMSEDSTWKYLLLYLYTLYKARKDLPVWDYTMAKAPEKGDKTWLVQAGDKEYKAVLIYATHHHSRQTCVFDSENKEDDEKSRVIKDIWPDSRRRFSEGVTLGKVKGDPGVTQAEISQTIPAMRVNPETEEKEDLGVDLQTSSNHSGNKPPCLPNRHAPKRVKHRHVFHTRGVPFKKRRTVREILEGAFDAAQGT